MALGNLPEKPNILILMTDQDTTALDWLPEFEEQHLPTMKRLKRHGLTFKNAFTAAAACSASRASILTSTYPTEHGVANTLVAAEDYLDRKENDASFALRDIGFAQNVLRPCQVNLAHIFRAAGYKVVWKGKWHLSQPVNGISKWSADDINYFADAYGFDEWNPDDAGDSMTDFKKLGGGIGNHDERYTGFTDENAPTAKEESALSGKSAIEFIRTYNEDKPFCLIVSLVNPHDIHVAPTFPEKSGYKEEEVPDYKLPIPENVNEDLTEKPDIQVAWREIQINADRADKSISKKECQQKYVDFYGYLKTLSDRQMGKILDALDAKGLTENTLIVRLADHGEMCLHHGLREKMYNAYDQSMKVPLIFSNPRLFPEAKETEALASSVDLVPTLASIIGVYDQYRFALRGCDLTPIFTKPKGKVRDYVHFTTDEDFLPDVYKNIPKRVRAIRSLNWKYVVYFTNDGSKFDYELYNLKKDPHENNNLIGKAGYFDEQAKLHAELQNIMMQMKSLPEHFWFVSKHMEEEGIIPPVHWPTLDEAWSGAMFQHEYNKLERSLEKSKKLKSKQLAYMAKNLSAPVWWVRKD
jgi:arylsulfatase A-like enzyme